MRIIAIIFMLMPLLSVAQTESKASAYIPPVDIPIHLSANFGEVRSTHFHAGIDIKTQGVEGKNIVAVADGYISRISISATGYGKALYITHPQLGTTTVYGHLKELCGEVKDYVKNYQYAHKKFPVGLFPAKDRFKVKQGDIIALSGNSGSSGGPHLHFEVRNTISSNPIDPIIACQYPVLDNIPPSIFSVGAVEIDNSYGAAIHLRLPRIKTLKSAKGDYTIEGDTIFVSRDSYLTFEITDKKSNSSNVFATRTLSLKSSGLELWGSHTDMVSFSYGAAVSSYALYPETTTTRNDIIRTYIAATNPLKYYTSRINKGVIYLSELAKEPLNLTFTATDEMGNSSKLDFVVAISKYKFQKVPSPEGEVVHPSKFHTFSGNGFTLVIPPYSLQQEGFMNVVSYADSLYTMSQVVNVGSNEMPYRKGATLSIALKGSNIDTSKVYIAQLYNGKSYPLTSECKNGMVLATIYSSGTYVVLIDTTPPKILSNWSKRYPIQNFISFKVTDQGSGIASYNGWINGKWELFEYDPKTSRILHYLDPKITPRGVENRIKIEVADKKGNKSIFNTKFEW